MEKKQQIKNEIRFLDSFKFMASSLNSLVGNLAKSGLEKLKKKIVEAFRDCAGIIK